MTYVPIPIPRGSSNITPIITKSSLLLIMSVASRSLSSNSKSRSMSSGSRKVVVEVVVM